MTYIRLVALGQTPASLQLTSRLHRIGSLAMVLHLQWDYLWETRNQGSTDWAFQVLPLVRGRVQR